MDDHDRYDTAFAKDVARFGMSMKSSATDDLPDFTVVIPCYNEMGAIERTIDELRKAVPRGTRFRMIVVDDGSTDDTKQILHRIPPADDLLILDHARNRGYGAALKTGIRAASTELIAITDADGTYPNERLPELVAACAQYDMVVGARTGENVQYSKLRSIPQIFPAALDVLDRQAKHPGHQFGYAGF